MSRPVGRPKAALDPKRAAKLARLAEAERKAQEKLAAARAALVEGLAEAKAEGASIRVLGEAIGRSTGGVVRLLADADQG